MDLYLGTSMILKAIQMERDAALHLQWCVQLPFMTKKNYVSFNDYRDSVTGANIDKRPDEVLIAEIDEIEKQMQNKGADDGNL